MSRISKFDKHIEWATLVAAHKEGYLGKGAIHIDTLNINRGNTSKMYKNHGTDS
jgi:hypothetical protein